MEAGPLPGLFLTTRHFRNGILLAPITARLMAQAASSGGLHPWTSHRSVSIASSAAEPPGRHSTPRRTRPSGRQNRKTASGWPSAARSS
ncbi:MAG TPA: hypothetical protein VE057_02945 [Archangium sp.]|nr:hypothetical protein [Archangium sp.]